MGLQVEREVEERLAQGALVPRLGEVLRTKSGKVELAAEYIRADLPRLEEGLGREIPEKKLPLVSRGHIRSNNSWMHGVPSLVTGKNR